MSFYRVHLQAWTLVTTEVEVSADGEQEAVVLAMEQAIKRNGVVFESDPIPSEIEVVSVEAV